jgi:hypothetical protein
MPIHQHTSTGFCGSISPRPQSRSEPRREWAVKCGERRDGDGVDRGNTVGLRRPAQKSFRSSGSHHSGEGDRCHRMLAVYPNKVVALIDEPKLNMLYRA